MPPAHFSFNKTNMIKKYQSTTECSLPIYPSYGGYKYIRFLSNMEGGGTFITEDKYEQDAIEALPGFGMSIKLVESIGEEKEAENATEEAIDAVDVTKVYVSDIGEAKEYLVDNYGYSASNLRSKKAILEAASEKGIEFVGI